LRPQQLELIDALVAETSLGGITAGLLEKDEHLTDALRVLFALPLDGMHLAFCGNTPWTSENAANANFTSFSSAGSPLAGAGLAGDLRRGGLRLDSTGPTRGAGALEGRRQPVPGRSRGG
jgi:hypothetical protein